MRGGGERRGETGSGGERRGETGSDGERWGAMGSDGEWQMELRCSLAAHLLLCSPVPKRPWTSTVHSLEVGDPCIRELRFLGKAQP